MAGKPSPEIMLGRLYSRIEVDSESGCWNWTCGLTKDGYAWGQWHRRAWELLRGPIPDGYEIDHLCRNRACLNPDHLEPVTHAENVRRSEVGRVNREKTHCRNGHEFTPKNTVRSIRNGSWRRACRTCQAEAAKRHYWKREATVRRGGQQRVFDWDEAKRLRDEGLTLTEVGRRLGVTRKAVSLAINPELRARDNERRQRLRKAG